MSETAATVFACIIVGLIILAGVALIVLAIRDDVRARHFARQVRTQREADEHTFDLISKGKGGAV